LSLHLYLSFTGAYGVVLKCKHKVSILAFTLFHNVLYMSSLNVMLQLEIRVYKTYMEYLV